MGRIRLHLLGITLARGCVLQLPRGISWLLARVRGWLGRIRVGRLLRVRLSLCRIGRGLWGRRARRLLVLLRVLLGRSRRLWVLLRLLLILLRVLLRRSRLLLLLRLRVLRLGVLRLRIGLSRVRRWRRGVSIGRR